MRFVVTRVDLILT